MKRDFVLFEKMLRQCEAKRGNAIEIAVAGLRPPLSGNLKVNALQSQYSGYMFI